MDDDHHQLVPSKSVFIYDYVLFTLNILIKHYYHTHIAHVQLLSFSLTRLTPSHSSTPNYFPSQPHSHISSLSALHTASVSGTLPSLTLGKSSSHSSAVVPVYPPSSSSPSHSSEAGHPSKSSAYVKAVGRLAERMPIRRRGTRTEREMVEVEGHHARAVDLVQAVVVN